MGINISGLIGTVAAVPEPYHNLYGRENVYALWLDTARDSGVIDRVLVLFQEQSIEAHSFIEETAITLYSNDKPVLTEVRKTEPDYETPGALAALIKENSRIEVTGAIQTYKDRSTGRVQLFVWGLYLGAAPKNSQQLNIVYINGEVAKTPIYRETPKGRHITEIFLRILSEFAEDFYSYIPCITWEKLAEQAAELPEDTEVYLEGRIQSREYTKKTPEGEQILTTWEVSARKLIPVIKDCNTCVCQHCKTECLMSGCTGCSAYASQERMAEIIKKCYKKGCQHFEQREGE